MRTNHRKMLALTFAALTFPLIAYAGTEATALPDDNLPMTLASTSGSNDPTATGETAHHPAIKHHSVQKTTRAKKSTGEVGLASWYGGERDGHQTASGESLNSHELTAAHRTLPLHSRVRVTNLANGRSVMVRITDRGPHMKGRIIDLSQSAAEQLGMKHKGVARVRLEPESPHLINTAG
jgi:rare lipoprotein A